MSRIIAAAPVALVVFVAALALSAVAVARGLVPNDAMTLWAAAVAAADGEVPIGRIVAAYPTVPFLATTFVDLLLPAGTPGPALLTAGLLGVLAGTWFLSFRNVGLSRFAAVSAVLLLALHPALLRAVVAGSAEIFFVAFLYLFASALFQLRARSAAAEVMAVGLALLGLTFSHPLGAAVAVASVPFLVFAVRPVLVAASAFNIVIVLIFPAVFAVAAFAYVSWVFPGSGWSFLTAPTESLSAWAAGVAPVAGATGWVGAYSALAVALALALGAPIAAAALVMARRRRPLVAPPVILVSTTIAAAAMTVVIGVFGEPTPLIVAAPILAAAVITHMPVIAERHAMILPMLALGWIGGAAGLSILDARVADQVRMALAKGVGDRERLDALELGGATIGRDEVLIDTHNAPAVVLGRGQARGFSSPTSEAFTLAMLFARIEAPFVAVPDPQSVAGAQDRLNKAFPNLYRDGAPGYRLLYQNRTWRLFARHKNRPVNKSKPDPIYDVTY